MTGKMKVRTITTRSGQQPAQLVEDGAVEIVMALFPLAVVGSIFLVGAPYGWALGVAAGVGLWTVIGAIIVVCACFLSSKA